MAKTVYIRYHQEAWRYEIENQPSNLDWLQATRTKYYIPGIGWSRTKRRGSPLDPRSGFRQIYSIEGAHLQAGSDASFMRLHGRWNYIKTLKENHRLVTRADSVQSMLIEM